MTSPTPQTAPTPATTTTSPPARPPAPALTHTEALILAVLRDWPGAHSVSTLADRRRLIGVQVPAIRLTADRLARRGLAERAGFGNEYQITDAGHDTLTAHEQSQPAG